MLKRSDQDDSGYPFGFYRDRTEVNPFTTYSNALPGPFGAIQGADAERIQAQTKKEK